MTGILARLRSHEASTTAGGAILPDAHSIRVETALDGIRSWRVNLAAHVHTQRRRYVNSRETDMHCFVLQTGPQVE
jgi:hypothetical protein